LKRESKYNLSDDDEYEANVHNMLSEKDDFDEEAPLDDGSDDEGMLIIVSGWNTILSSFCYRFIPLDHAKLSTVYVHPHYVRYEHVFSVTHL